MSSVLLFSRDNHDDTVEKGPYYFVPCHIIYHPNIGQWGSFSVSFGFRTSKTALDSIFLAKFVPVNKISNSSTVCQIPISPQ